MPLGLGLQGSLTVRMLSLKNLDIIKSMHLANIRRLYDILYPTLKRALWLHVYMFTRFIFILTLCVLVCVNWFINFP